ncbi:MAG: hypothetical protein ACE5GM_10370 [bacterium]
MAQIRYQVKKAVTTVKTPKAAQRYDLSECLPGEKVLIVRRYGGLGDMLIITQIFPELIGRYAHLRFSFSCPVEYHELFTDCQGLELLDFNRLESYRFDFNYLVDISTPCHIWENLFVRNKHALLWRNRLNIWAEWIGYRPEAPVSCLSLAERELTSAEERIKSTARHKFEPKRIGFAPLSHLWCKDLQDYEGIYQDLENLGYEPYYIHYKSMPGRQIKGESYRELGALLARMDLLLTVDTSVLHWGGVLGIPTIGLFSMNDGAAYGKYYPSVRQEQWCPTPCIAHGVYRCSRRLLNRYCYGGVEEIRKKTVKLADQFFKGRIHEGSASAEKQYLWPGVPGKA